MNLILAVLLILHFAASIPNKFHIASSIFLSDSAKNNENEFQSLLFMLKSLSRTIAETHGTEGSNVSAEVIYLSIVVMIIDLKDNISLPVKSHLFEELNSEMKVNLVLVSAQEFENSRYQIQPKSNWNSLGIFSLFLEVGIPNQKSHKPVLDDTVYLFLNSKLFFWLPFRYTWRNILDQFANQGNGLSLLTSGGFDPLFCRNQFLLISGASLEVIKKLIPAGTTLKANVDGSQQMEASVDNWFSVIVDKLIQDFSLVVFSFPSPICVSPTHDTSFIIRDENQISIVLLDVLKYDDTAQNDGNENLETALPLTISYDWNETCTSHLAYSHEFMKSMLMNNIHGNRFFCEELVNFDYFALALHQRNTIILSSPYDDTRESEKTENISETAPLSLNTPSFSYKKVYLYNWTGFIDYSLIDFDHPGDDYGYGPELAPFFYNSSMHSLFSVFYNRLSRLKLSTQPDLAKLFVIPYDIVLDTPYGDAFRAVPGCPNALRVMNELNQSKEWHAHQGRDHILIVSTLMSNLLTHRNCGYFVLSFCKYCIKITIEDLYHSSYFLSSPDLGTYLNRELIQSNDNLLHFLEDSFRVLAVPYPSSYHFPSSWKEKDFYHYFYGKKDALQREYLSVFVGSLQNRLSLKTACLSVSRPEQCLWLETTRENLSVIPSMVTNYRRSTFCFIPKGDTFSRKAFIDAILSGCIPIVFHLESCHFLYPIHLPMEMAANICYYYDPNAFEENPMALFSSLERLQNNPEIYLKRKFIARIASQLQYSLWDKEEADPPTAMDAFDVTFSKLFRISSDL
jgi:hypothetical protein